MSCASDGSPTTCRVALKTPSETGTLDLWLASSNQSIKLPATITIKPGQPSVRFRIDSISPGQRRSHYNYRTARRRHSPASRIPRFTPGTTRGSRLSICKIWGLRFSSAYPRRILSQTLTASGLPAGAVFDATSGAFYWVPGVASQGTHHVVFTGSRIGWGGDRGKFRP